MFRMVECVLELDAGEVWAQAAMKKRLPLTAFRDGAFAIEHVPLAGLASWAVSPLLPFAYPAVCAADADLLFVHFPHFLIGLMVEPFDKLRQRIRWTELLSEIQINKDKINPAGIQSKQ